MLSARALLFAIVLVPLSSITRPAAAAWVSSCSTPAAVGQYVSLYSNGVDNCFEGSIPGTGSFTQTSVVHSGTKAISFSMANWNYVQFQRPGMTTSFTAIDFWVNSGSTAGQDIVLTVGDKNGREVLVHLAAVLGRALPANQWVNLSVPFPWSTTSDAIIIAFGPATGSARGTVYLDDVRLLTATAGACTGAAGTSCSDASLCNGSEVCDGAGHCLAGVPLATSDVNPCTIDRCDPVTGVTHTPAPAGLSCGVDSLCATMGSCDGAGACAAAPKPYDLRVYADGLESCFTDRSWAVRNLGETERVHEGFRGLLVEPDNWNALSFTASVADAGYHGVALWVNGGAGTGQIAWLTISDASGSLVRQNLAQSLVAGTWVKVTTFFPRASVKGTITLGVTAETSADQPAFYLDDIRLLGDRSPPVISVISPNNGALLASTDVAVEVLWQDSTESTWISGLDLGSARVSLDGVDVSAQLAIDSDGVRGLLMGVAQGSHQIVFTVADKAGNSASAASSFRVDSVAPTVTWTNPPPVTAAAEVPLGFTVNDATSGVSVGSIEVDANQLLVTGVLTCDPIGPDGLPHTSCVGTYPLDEGTWHLQVTARDLAGNVGTAVTEVLVDRSPPIVVLDPDVSGIMTASPTISLIGRIVDASATSLTVNGLSVAVQGNAFSTQVELHDGANAIILRAVDQAGNIATRTVTVTRDSDPPVVSDLYVAGISDSGLLCPESPTVARHILVTSTMSPRLTAHYSDARAGVNSSAISVAVDGRPFPCTALSDQAKLGWELSCPLELKAGDNMVSLAIPDRTAVNVRRCYLRVEVDAVTVRGDPAGALAAASVEMPRDFAQARTLSLSAAASAPQGTTVGGGAARTVGPGVDIISDPPLDPSAAVVLRITLPYDSQALRTDSSDELTAADVRVHWLDGASWRPETPGQWMVDTVAKTISYTATHLSIRAATVSTKRPLATAWPAVALDNGHAATGDKRLLVFDGLDVRNLTLASKLTAPLPVGSQPPELGLDGGGAVPLGEASETVHYVKAVRPTPDGGFAALIRSVWSAAQTATHDEVTYDFDDIVMFTSSGLERWRVRLAGQDATTVSPTSSSSHWKYHTQQTIRDFAFSTDGTKIFIIGDASFGDRLSQGDGIYVLNILNFAPKWVAKADKLVNQLVVGESAALAVSNTWGEDALFVIGSGPRGWITGGGRLNLSGESSPELAAKLALMGTPTLAAFGPYAGYEFTTLADLQDVNITHPCVEQWFPITADGHVDDNYNNFSAQSLAEVLGPGRFVDFVLACEPGLEGGMLGPPWDLGRMKFLRSVSRDRIARALLVQSELARQPFHNDLVSRMLEAGQIAVFQWHRPNPSSQPAMVRVGTVPLSDLVQADANPPADYTLPFDAPLGDPSSTVAINGTGRIWVRQTRLHGTRYGCAAAPALCPENTDPERVAFLGQLRWDSMLSTAQLDTSLSLHDAVRSPSRQRLLLAARDAAADDLGRGTVAVGVAGDPVGMAVTVAPNGDVILAQPRTDGSGVTSAVVAALPSPETVDPAHPQYRVSTHVDASTASLGDHLENVFLVAATYDDDDASNDECSANASCLAPRSLLLGLRAAPGSTAFTGALLYGESGGFSFAGVGQTARSPVTFFSPQSTVLMQFAYPKPVLSRLASDGTAFSGIGLVNDVRVPAVGQLKIVPRYLNRTSPSGLDLRADGIALPLLQQIVDYRPLGTPERRTVALRVFVADAYAETTVFRPSSMWSTATGSLAPTVLVEPRPLLGSGAFDGLPDPRYSFLVVADPTGPSGVSIVADCDDTGATALGTVTRYGEYPYDQAPYNVAPAVIEDCYDKNSPSADASAFCLHQMPLQAVDGVVQSVYVDLVVCGAKSQPDSGEAAQRSLASEPLKAIIGALPCAAGSGCASGHCVDGLCCDSACGGGDPNDCQSCSRAAGGSEDGTCTANVKGTICGSKGTCPLPPTCDGESVSCPSLESLGLPHPGAPEVCNLRDDNCDGTVDEGCKVPSCDSSNPASDSTCGPLDFTADFKAAFKDYMDTNATFVPGRGETTPDLPGSGSGAFTVTPDGAASYTLPLELPPGRGSVTPSLALEYNSRRGNGVLGVGWALTGLSEIRRCNHTYAQDGFARGTELDAHDALCLDGVRLAATGGTGCPAPGVEYRPVQNPFTRICAYPHLPTGTVSDGPLYFRVWFKNGNVAEYGTLTGLETKALGAVWNGRHLVPIAWPMTRLEDRRGNYMTVEYQETWHLTGPWWTSAPEYASPSYMVSEIRYAGTPGGGATTRMVKLGYESRPDIITGFFGGSSVSTVYRLSKVVGSVNDILAKEYRLSYGQSPTGRSRLESVTECANDSNGQSVCNRPTTFTWSAGAGLFTTVLNPLIDWQSGTPATVVETDGKDGDEMLFGSFLHRSVNGRLVATVQMPIGQVHPTDYTGNCGSSGATLAIDHPLLPLDFNGDGRQEFVRTAIDRLEFLTGTGTVVSEAVPAGTPVSGVQTSIVGVWGGDFDGNGVQDVLAEVGQFDLTTCRYTGAYELQVMLNGADGLGQLVPIGASLGFAMSPLIGDFDGDGSGSDQIVYYSPSSNYPQEIAYRLVENSASPPTGDRVWESSVFYVFDAVEAIDLNRDGLTDFITVDGGVWMNQGRRLFQSIDTGLPAHPAYTFEGGTVDLDDGRPSALLWYIDGSTGKKTWATFSMAASGQIVVQPLRTNVADLSSVTSMRAIDVTADGMDDLVTDGGLLLHRSGTRNDLLVGVRSSLNPEPGGTPTVQISYKWPTDPSVYTPRSDSLPCDGHGSVCVTPRTTLVSWSCTYRGEDLPCYQTSYSYADGHSVPSGRGWLGFAQQTTTSPTTDKPYSTASVVTTSYFDVGKYDAYSRDYPFARLPVHIVQTTPVQNGPTRVDEVTRSPKVYAVDATKSTYFVHIEQETTSVSEIPQGAQDPIPLGSVSTTSSYDSFANLLTSDTSAATARSSTASVGALADLPWLKDLLEIQASGPTRHIVRTYRNDEATWRLGLILTQKTSGVSAYCNARSNAQAAPFSVPWTEATADCPDLAGRQQSISVDYFTDEGRQDLPHFVYLEPENDTRKLTITLAFDAYGNVQSVTRAGYVDDGKTVQERTRTRTYEPLEHLFPATEVDESGHVTSVVYDRLLGLPALVQDARGAVVIERHDAFGRVIAAGTSGGGMISHSRRSGLGTLGNGASVIVDTRDSGGRLVTSEFDRLGRLVDARTYTARGEIVTDHPTYDLAGRLATQTVPHLDGQTGRVLNFAYDSVGRPTSLDGPGGKTTLSYDGLVATMTDPAGRAQKRIHNASGDIIASVGSYVDSKGATRSVVARYYYGFSGGLWRVADGASTATGGDAASPNITTIVLDAYGRRTSLLDPDLGVRGTSYNAFGETIADGDGMGHSTSLEYDLEGRAIRETSGTEVTEVTWDTAAPDLVASVQGPDGHSVAYTYDQYGRQASSTTSVTVDSFGAQDLKFTATYDWAGRLRTLKYPTTSWNYGLDFTVRYVYDSIGELQKVERVPASGNAYQLWRVDERDDLQRIKRETFGAGLATVGGGSAETTFGFSTTSTWLESITTKTGSTNRMQVDLGHDNAGNVTGRTLRLNGQLAVQDTYELDDLSRLRTVTGLGGTLNVDYDAIGNISSKSDVGAYSYVGAGPHAVMSAGSTAFAYDGRGNQKTRGDMSLTYTSEDKPQTVTQGGVEIARYEYDGFGRRVVKKAGGANAAGIQARVYLGDLYEQRLGAAGGAEVAYVVYALDRPVAQFVTGSSSGDRYLYLHSDQLGSVNAITSDGGVSAGVRAYDAFGKLVSSDSDYLAEVNIGFGGHEDERDLSLVNMGGRIYDPIVGRFTSADPYIQHPYSSEGLNRYSYVGNNPTSFIDPTGYGRCTVIWGGYGDDKRVLVNTCPQQGGGGAHVLRGNQPGPTGGFGGSGALEAWYANEVAKVLGAAATGGTYTPDYVGMWGAGVAGEYAGQQAGNSQWQQTTGSNARPLARTATRAEWPGFPFKGNIVLTDTGFMGVREPGMESSPFQIDMVIPSVGMVVSVSRAGVRLLSGNAAKAGVEAIEEVAPKLLGPGTKIGAKIQAQLAGRGWNRAAIDKLIGNPAATRAVRDTRFSVELGRRLDEPATAFFNAKGHYIVRNDLTGDIVQVSDRFDLGWIWPW